MITHRRGLSLTFTNCSHQTHVANPQEKIFGSKPTEFLKVFNHVRLIIVSKLIREISPAGILAMDSHVKRSLESRYARIQFGTQTNFTQEIVLKLPQSQGQLISNVIQSQSTLRSRYIECCIHD